MKYLLDTHTFLWSIANTKELSRKVIKVIKEPENDVYISSVSLWEVSIKVRIKKLEIEGVSLEELPEIIEKLQYSQMSLTIEDAIGYASLAEPSHKDPFDRMLAYQCISRNMIIVSKDSAFSKFIPFGLKILW